MTALTGETGAGKSIIVDALGLALGDRTDASVVRHGAERAEVSATFTLGPGSPAHSAIEAWLAARDLDMEEGTCVLRRVIGREGRSRAYINGSPVPVLALRELGDLLVDIHGQHEHQSLLRAEHQRRVVDAFAAHRETLEALASDHRCWRALKDGLGQLESRRADREARLELLRFQVAELAALDLSTGELAELESEQARLANVEQILAGAQQVVMGLYEAEEQSADQILGRCLSILDGLSALDSRFGSARELLQSALIQSREAVDELRRYASALEADPARLQQVEDRLGRAHDLARKHRVSPASLPATLASLRHELAELEGADHRGEVLRQDLEQAEHRYRQRAAELAAGRRSAGAELGERVTLAMQGLGMKGGRLAVEVHHDDSAEPAAQGLDEVSFQVSANPGQPLQALAKVASGGELSRISLAIQVIAADESRVPTLVFDEVDMGIGGATAEVVGRLLRRLGERTQVLCVTHLPQVAAQAHQHIQVHKHVDGDLTRTQISALDAHSRVEEVARMLGGVQLTERSLAHAREMIEQARAAESG